MTNILDTTDTSIYVKLINAGQFILYGRLLFTVGGQLQKLCTGSIYYGNSKTLDIPTGAADLSFRIDASRCGYSKMVFNGGIPTTDPSCLLVYGNMCDQTLLKVYCSLDGLDSLSSCGNPCS